MNEFESFPEFAPFVVSADRQKDYIDTVLSCPHKYLTGITPNVPIFGVDLAFLNSATHLSNFDITDIRNDRIQWLDSAEFSAVAEGFSIGFKSGGLLLPHYPMKTAQEAPLCFRNIMLSCAIDPYNATIECQEDDISLVRGQNYANMQELAGKACMFLDRISGLEEVADELTDELMVHDITNALSFRTSYIIGVGAVAGAAHLVDCQNMEHQIEDINIDELCAQLLGSN